MAFSLSKTWRLVSLLAVMTLFGPSPAGAQELPQLPQIDQVPVSMSVRYYDVDGRRVSDAVEAMRFAGPIGYEAETRTWGSYYMEYEQTSQGCALSVLEIPLEVEILYPNWTGYDRARRSDRDRWDARMHVLTVHENVHALIALLGMVETYNDVVQEGPQPDCGALQDRVRSMVDAANDRLNVWQRDYDRVTNHGADQVDFDLQAFMAERL
ncbi:DUF922 domain-containing protein [Maricaulis sp.]|uniref:DUF922 domain-containing protein n=1 Tax=Maricaulis sp. TaxID=1486257 RepID=UPI003A93F337